VAVSTNLSIGVLVGANALQIGGAGTTTVGNSARTWYDGVSYSKVGSFQITSVNYDASNNAVVLVWSSVAASSSLSRPTYSVLKKNSLSDPVWSVLASRIPSDGSATSYTDTSASGMAAFYQVSLP